MEYHWDDESERRFFVCSQEALRVTKQQELDAARAARLKIMQTGVKAYTSVLGGQTTYLTLGELDATIARLEGEVALEGLGGPCPGIQEIGLQRM